SGISVAVSPASAANVGTTVTFTAKAAGCPNPLYEFWILRPGGSWTVARAYSGAASFSWSTGGLGAGGYRSSVWVRDAGSSAAYDAYLPRSPHAPLPPCSAVSAAAGPASAATVGTTVTFTAKAAGCPNPLYEFWILRPGGSWTVARAYASSASFSWNTG